MKLTIAANAAVAVIIFVIVGCVYTLMSHSFAEITELMRAVAASNENL